MSEWTTERLEALPKETLILAASGNPPTWMLLCRGVGEWWVVGSPDRYGPNEMDQFFDMSTIRVVSVPIDALLADDAIASTRILPGGRVGNMEWRESQRIIRAAIEHITGETL